MPINTKMAMLQDTMMQTGHKVNNRKKPDENRPASLIFIKTSWQ